MWIITKYAIFCLNTHDEDQSSMNVSRPGAVSVIFHSQLMTSMLFLFLLVMNTGSPTRNTQKHTPLSVDMQQQVATAMNTKNLNCLCTYLNWINCSIFDTKLLNFKAFAKICCLIHSSQCGRFISIYSFAKLLSEQINISSSLQNCQNAK